MAPQMTPAGYYPDRCPSRQMKSKPLDALGWQKMERHCGPARLSPRRSMAMRRSTQMLMLGLAIFVIGAGVVLVSLKGSGGGSGNTAASTTTTTIQAGTVVVNP